MIEGSIAGVVVHRDDKALYVNAAFAAMIGYTTDEFLALDSVSDFLAPEDRARMQKYAMARLKGGDAPSRYEFQAVCKDGSRIWIENLVRTIDWDGRPAVYVSARDITERKQAEEALRESEQRNAAMLQAIPDMIFRLDSEGTYLDFVPAEHFDPVTPPETFMGKRMDEVLPVEVARSGRQKIKQALKTKQAQTWEYTLHGGDEPRHLETRLITYGPGEVLAIVRDVTEQKSTERALKDNQQFLQALIDEMPTPINVKDRERRFVLLNRAIADWFGVDDRQKLIGKRAEECGMVNADLYAEADKHILKTGEEIANVEYRFPGESGLGTWLEAKTPIKDEDGTVQYIVTISLDISERKLAEEALQASEARFEALARSSPVGIFETDADLNGTLLNARWSEITGLSEKAALAQGWRKAIHPADRRRVAKEWRESMRTRAPVHTEYRYLSPQGETTWCLVNAVWLRDEAGEVTGCVGTTTDITELKAAAEALRESEQRNAAMLDAIPDMLARLDKHGTYLDFKAPKDLKPIMLEKEFMGKRLEDVLPPKAAKLGLQKIRRALRTGEVQTYEYVLERGGEKRDLEARLVAYGKDEVLSIIRNVTDQKAAEEALRESEQQKATMLEAIPDMILVMDGNGTYLDVVPAADFAPVYPRQKLLGSRVSDLHPPTFAQEALRNIRKAIRTNEIQTWEYSLTSEDVVRHFESRVARYDKDKALLVVRDVSGQKKMEAALRESEAQLRLVTNALPVLIGRFDQDERYLFVNEHYKAVFGVPSSEILGKSVKELLSKDHYKQAEPHIRAALSGKEASFEEWLYLPNGTRTERHVTLVPHLGQDKKVQGCFIVSTDVTEQKRAEDELRRSEASLVNAQRIAGLGSWEWDIQANVQHWSDEVYRILGLTPQKLQPSQERFLNCVHPDDRTMARNKDLEVLQEPKPVSFEYRVVHPDGDVRVVHERSEAVFDQTGKPIFLSGALQDVTEARRAEEALRLTQFAVDNATDAAFWIQPSGRFFYVNDAACRAVGYAREELLALAVSDIREDIALEMWPQQWRRVKRNRSMTFESEHRAKDGKVYPVEIAANYLKFGDSEYIVAFAKDITERKQAEKALSESREFLQSVIDEMPANIWVKDTDRRFVLANRQMTHWLGVDAQSIMGKRAEDQGSTRADLYARLDRQVIETAQPVPSFETSGEAAGGLHTWLETKTPIKDDRGKVKYILAFAIDITERKKTEEALRETEARLQSVAENIPGTVYQRVLEADGTIHYPYMSVGARELYGIEAEDVMADASILVAGFEPESRDHFMHALKESAKNLTPLNVESRLVLKSGEVKWMTTRSRPRRLDDGAVAWDGVALDDTERKEAEDRARQHEADLAHVLRLSTMGEMATALAHQLNQPLAAIANYTRGCLFRIQSGDWESSDLIAVLEKASHQAERAGRMVREMGDFARAPEPRTSIVDINDLVRSVVRFEETELQGNDVQLDLALTHGLPRVAVDEIEIEQVILNLVRNGIEAMADVDEDERRLAISTVMTDGGEIEIAVRDSGSGLSPDDRSELFEPFFSTKPKGMGMGLSIARTIVEAHGGRLWVADEPGPGATFSLALPANG